MEREKEEKESQLLGVNHLETSSKILIITHILAQVKTVLKKFNSKTTVTYLLCCSLAAYNLVKKDQSDQSDRGERVFSSLFCTDNQNTTK